MNPMPTVTLDVSGSLPKVISVPTSMQQGKPCCAAGSRAGKQSLMAHDGQFPTLADARISEQAARNDASRAPAAGGGQLA